MHYPIPTDIDYHLIDPPEEIPYKEEEEPDLERYLDMQRVRYEDQTWLETFNTFLNTLSK